MQILRSKGHKSHLISVQTLIQIPFESYVPKLHRHSVPVRVLTAVLQDWQFVLRPPLQVRQEEWQASHQFEPERYFDETQVRHTVSLEQVKQSVGQFSHQWAVDRYFDDTQVRHVVSEEQVTQVEGQTLQELPPVPM